MIARSYQRHPVRRLAMALLFVATLVLTGVAEAQTPRVSGGGELQQLTDALSYQIELVHRADGPEYDRRRRAVLNAVNAWNASGRASSDRAAFVAWLRMAIRASMPGRSRPMPAPPSFGAAASEREVIVSEPLENLVDDGQSSVSPADEDQPTIDQSSAEDDPASSGGAVDPEVAARLWSSSPAAASLPLEQLLQEAQEQGSEPPEAIVSVPATRTVSKPAVERPRQTVARTESVTPLDEALPTLELIPLEQIGGGDVLTAPGRLEMIDVGPSLVSRRVPTPAPTELAAPEPPAVADDEQGDTLLAAAGTPSVETQVTVRRPNTEPAEGPQTVEEQASSQESEQPLFDVVKVVSAAEIFNQRLQRVESALSTEPSPTAFQLSSWAQELERLGRQRQFVAIYLAGLNEEQQSAAPALGSAERAIRLLRKQAAVRKRMISDLPEQAVRAEADALIVVERKLPLIEDSHR